MAGRARGYIYTRMESEEPGAAYKHELELNEIRKYTHEAGMEILGEYMDENYGPENIRSWYDFLWMKNEILHGNCRIDFIITSTLSCMGRNMNEIQENLKLFQDHGVKLVCLDDQIDMMNSSENLLTVIISAVSGIFQEDLKLERENLSWEEGSEPYGCKFINGELKIEAEEQQIVHKIFRDYSVDGNMNNTIMNLKQDVDHEIYQPEKFVKNILNDSIYWRKHGQIVPTALGNKVYEQRIKNLYLWQQKYNRNINYPLLESEKLLYKEKAEQFGVENILWGEDLVDKKLIIYKIHLRNVEDYMDFSENLSTVFLCVIRYRFRMLELIKVQYDESAGNIYISEKQFNAVWIDLKWSVRFGIEREIQHRGECILKSANQIVLLQYLCNKKIMAHLVDNKITYERRRHTEECQMDTGIKQRMLDNPRFYFFYSCKDGYVHDKSCDCLKPILSEDFVGSEVFPEGRTCCPECGRTMLVRYGCRPRKKDMLLCGHMLTRFRLSTQELSRLVLECGLRFEAIDINSMKVTGKEDSWIIKEDTLYHTLELWHNNYIRLNKSERYITEGFHNQWICESTMKELLNYIASYTWGKHLEGEKQRRLRRKQRIVAIHQFSCMPDEAVFILGDRKKKLVNIPTRIHDWKKGRRG